MIYAIITVLAIWVGFLKWENLNLNRSQNDLGKRLTNLEVKHDTLNQDVTKTGEQWAQIFADEQASWSKHIQLVTDRVTTQLALGQETRQRNRR